MSFRIAYETLKFNTPLRSSRVGKAKPLALHHGRDLNGNPGVYLLMFSPARPEVFAACFFPDSHIAQVQEAALRDHLIDEVNALNAGHSPSPNRLAGIEAIVKSDLPGWSVPLLESQPREIDTLKITQSGVSMWRMLELAMLHGAGAGDPRVFAGSSSVLAVNQYLMDGNHRVCFADLFGISALPTVTVPVSSRAMGLRMALEDSCSAVRNAFGADKPFALAISFARQVGDLIDTIALHTAVPEVSSLVA